MKSKLGTVTRKKRSRIGKTKKQEKEKCRLLRMPNLDRKFKASFRRRRLRL